MAANNVPSFVGNDTYNFRRFVCGHKCACVDEHTITGYNKRVQGVIGNNTNCYRFWGKTRHPKNWVCGNCGSATRSRGGGSVLSCTDPDCGREHFPRTDPAVIMLVTREGADGGACLLARSPRFFEGMYSTLAGFVDQGESLEEAVIREVKEEAGIDVTDATYMASQPWPFPASLMLGFRARATSIDIAYDADELADAQWFTSADIARFDDIGKRLPRTDSIARWLVDTWLAEGTA